MVQGQPQVCHKVARIMSTLLRSHPVLVIKGHKRFHSPVVSKYLNLPGSFSRPNYPDYVFFVQTTRLLLDGESSAVLAV